MSFTKLYGYRRAGGAWGIRNYTLVLSTVHCSASVAQQIAQRAGVPAVLTDKGCVENVESHSLTAKGLLGAALGPNVHSVLIVGLGCEQTDAEAIRAAVEASGRPVAYIRIQDYPGPPEAVNAGVEAALTMKALADGQPRELMPLSALSVGVQCGGSDWTTALSGNTTIGQMSDYLVAEGGTVLIGEVLGFPGSEHILAQNAVSREAGVSILKMANEIREDFACRTGHAIEAVNPTPGNKEGGITTLVEKSMGNIKKVGHSPISGVVALGSHPQTPGVWIVDNRLEGPDSVNTSGFALGGAHLVAFSSGRGSPLGNAILPVVKVTGNSQSFLAMPGIFDFDAGPVLDGESLESAGRRLLEAIIEVANGKLTRSEINGNREFTLPFLA